MGWKSHAKEKSQFSSFGQGAQFLSKTWHQRCKAEVKVKAENFI